MNCRFGTKREAPFDIPAGATEVIECMLEPGNLGPFEAQLHVFVDDLGVRETVLKVRGTAGPKGPQKSNAASAEPSPE